MIEKHGARNWAFISREFSRKYGIHNKNGKQCRERWNNHLSPEVSRDSWTAKEEKVLFDLHKIHGNKWSVIAAELKGRTDNSTKNHFYSIVRKNLRRYNKTKPDNEKILGNVQDLLKDPELSKILLKKPRHYYQKKGSKSSDSKKTSEKTSNKSSKRTSRSSIPKLDPDLLKSSLEKVKELRERPRANIRVRRSSTTSSIGQFLSPGTILSYRSSLSKLDLNLEANAILPSPVYLDSYRASNRSSAAFLFENGYQAAGGFNEATPRSAWNYLDGTSAFSRRESRNNTGDSDGGSNLLQCSNRTSVVKSFDGIAGEIRPDCEQAGLVLNFKGQLPEYTPRNSFQFNKTPRHK